jgi:hypothetical protein
MKANELRLGNWVDNGGGDNYIIDTSWMMDIMNEAQVNNGMAEVKPIPLTEEWLDKFRDKDEDVIEWTSPFHSYRYCFDNSKVYILKNYFDVVINDDGVFFILQGLDDNSERSTGYYDTADVKLEYVHQLQNLYFALTGNELLHNRT